MTDLRTELVKILRCNECEGTGRTSFFSYHEHKEKMRDCDSCCGSGYKIYEPVEQVIIAIENLYSEHIKERYVEREKSDILAREYVDNYWRERSCDFISHQEAYEIAKNAVDIDEDDNLRTAFKIPEGKE